MGERKGKLKDRQDKSRYNEMDHRNERQQSEQTEEDMENNNGNEDNVSDDYSGYVSDLPEDNNNYNPYSPSYNVEAENRLDTPNHRRWQQLEIRNPFNMAYPNNDPNEVDEYDFDGSVDINHEIEEESGDLERAQIALDDEDNAENNTFENSRRRFRQHVANVRATLGL